MLKIVAVSYLNTLPFLYGIQNSRFTEPIDLETQVPSVCFDKVIKNQVDIGLVPVAAIPMISGYKIITDYCIGSNGAVDTVLLLSNKPINQINQIYLDNESKTSVELVKVLSKYYWKINPEFLNNTRNIDSKESVLMIGDKTFVNRNNYSFIYDLAFEWKHYTSLPFVFACWVAKKSIGDNLINDFNSSLKKGVENIDDVVNHYKNIIPDYVDAKKYYSESIDYKLNSSKIEAMNLFLNYLKNNL